MAARLELEYSSLEWLLSGSDFLLCWSMDGSGFRRYPETSKRESESPRETGTKTERVETNILEAN